MQFFSSRIKLMFQMKKLICLPKSNLFSVIFICSHRNSMHQVLFTGLFHSASGSCVPTLSSCLIKLFSISIANTCENVGIDEKTCSETNQTFFIDF